MAEPIVLKTDKEVPIPHTLESISSICKVVISSADDEGTLLSYITKYKPQIILTCYGVITKNIIQSALPHLKAIIKYGVGIDAIDVAFASEVQIPVINVPRYAEETVAEHAFALLLQLAKRSKRMHMLLEAEPSRWIWPSQEHLAWDVSGKTLGIVGFGKIGRSMARMGKLGFNMKVIAYDPNVSKEEMATTNFVTSKIDNLSDLMEQSDFVSVHATLDNKNAQLIGSKEIGIMKKTSFLINTARGNLVDESALVKAVKDKQIAGVGIDVFSEEPINEEWKEIADWENVEITPHFAWYTEEAVRRLEEETSSRIHEVLLGKPIPKEKVRNWDACKQLHKEQITGRNDL